MFTTRHIRANIVHSLGLTKGEVKWEGIMLESSLLGKKEEPKEEPAPTQIKKHSNTVERVIAHKENDPIDIQFDENNKLKKESLVDLLCDLDGMAGVERTNRGWFRRTFFGGGDQKEVVGEMQLKLLLSGKGKEEINEIYSRVTGDTEGLNISRDDLKAEATAPSSRFDFDHGIQSKITKFQIALIQDVDVVATLSSILLKDKDARTGLRAVLEGKTQTLQAALNDPKKMENFTKTLEENGVLERDPSFLEKVASVLLRMGISAGFSIFSAGALGGYMEQSKLRVNESGEFKRDGLNLTAKKGFGTDGSVSAGVSADLVGIRGELNINDPETRIQRGIADVMSSENILQASMALVTRVNVKYNAGARPEDAPELSEKENTRATTIANLGVAYLKAQEKLEKLPDSQAKTNALAQNTLIYLSKVEKLEGAQFKGIFAAANLAGVFVGLSGATVDVSSSSHNLKVGAGVIEGQVLGTEKLSESQVQEKLNELGITRVENTYLQDGKTLIEVPEGKKVQWQFEKIITDRDTIIRAIPIPIDANQTSQSTLISLKRENVAAENKYIQTNSQKVSELMHSLRQTDARTSSLQKAITEGKYDDAIKILTSILQASKNSTAKGLLEAMKELDSPAKKSDFFNLLLSKTSGGKMSLEFGKKIDSDQDVSKDLRAYYDKIADAFAKQYGISKSQVMEQFDAIAGGGLTKDNVHQFGDTFKDGFTGVVAFSQINKGGARFAELHKIINNNARMIGNPNEVTDTDFANKIREKIKAKITHAEIENFKKGNPDIVGQDDNAIKSLMVAGKVSSYLSYEDSAQCFNLGFVVEPGKHNQPRQGETDGTMVQGTTVGASEGNMFMYGAGPGLSWDKIFKKREEPKKEETKQEEPKKDEPKKPDEPKKEQPKEPEPEKPTTEPGNTKPTPPPKPESKPPTTEPGNTTPKPKPESHPHPRPEPKPEPKPTPPPPKPDTKPGAEPKPEPKPRPEPTPPPRPITKPGVIPEKPTTPVPPPASQTVPTTYPKNIESAPPTVITTPRVEVTAPVQPVAPAAAPAAVQNSQSAITASAPAVPNAAVSAPISPGTAPTASGGGRS